MKTKTQVIIGAEAMVTFIDGGDYCTHIITKSQAKKLRKQLKPEKVRDWEWAKKQMRKGDGVRQEHWPKGEFIAFLWGTLFNERGQNMSESMFVGYKTDWQLA